jgi:outer membrane murein-binding lipoprotein Lpp
MFSEEDHKLLNFIAATVETMREQMATKADIARLESRMETMDARTTAIQGDIEQVHIRFDSLDRRLDTRVDQIETDVSRLRSVVYLLVKDKPDMLRLLGQTTPRENPPQG